MTVRCKKAEPVWFLLIAAMLFGVAVLTRPLMPIDETRYATVAWEMWLRGDWFAPLTLNFSPYSHKPPMLFWMIDLFWSIFGVNRWAATLPAVLMAFANIFLISRIHNHLFPAENSRRASWMMLGSVPFLIYCTLILFDLSLAVYVQLAMICLLNFSKEGKLRWMIVMGVVLGLGVLTKGPVAYLYIIFPALLGPLWFEGRLTKARWYGGFLLAVLASIPPVLLWLIPVLNASDDKFAFWLVWNQTAGRITGNFEDSHRRSFFFYFMVLPLVVLPWAFFPAFWRGLKETGKKWRADPSVRLLMIWIVPTFIAFCLISGKQPHYLVPLLPAVMMYTAHSLRDSSGRRICVAACSSLFLFVAAHVVLGQTLLKHYDLKPIALKVKTYEGRDIAFVRNYHGELGFLGGLERPIDDVNRENIRAWFKDHPSGVAVIRYDDPAEVEGFSEVMSVPYRNKSIGVFTLKGR